MKANAARLKALEAAHAARGDETAPDEAASRWRMLSTPVRQEILLNWADSRARRRATSGPGRDEHRDWRRWWDASWVERVELVRAELAGLETLQAAHGERDGLAAWLAEEATWPIPSGVSIARADLALFDRRLANRRAELDDQRRDAPAWQAAHPAWRDGMTAEQHDAFEQTLLPQGMEDVTTRYVDRLARWAPAPKGTVAHG